MSATQNLERRAWARMETLFPVLVESPLFGFKNCIAHNVSPGGIFLETREPLPLGSHIRLYFALPESMEGISASGKVRNHYFLNFGDSRRPTNLTGMGVRFTAFDSDGDHRLSCSLCRQLH